MPSRLRPSFLLTLLVALALAGCGRLGGDSGPDMATASMMPGGASAAAALAGDGDTPVAIIVHPPGFDRAASRLAELNRFHEGRETLLMDWREVTKMVPPVSQDVDLRNWTVLTRNELFVTGGALIARLAEFSRAQRISSVLLLGDTALVPPSALRIGSNDPAGSDFFYASPDLDDQPEWPVGRIPVADPAAAEAYAGKLAAWYAARPGTAPPILVAGGDPLDNQRFVGEGFLGSLQNQDAISADARWLLTSNGTLTTPALGAGLRELGASLAVLIDAGGEALLPFGLRGADIAGPSPDSPVLVMPACGLCRRPDAIGAMLIAPGLPVAVIGAPLDLPENGYEWERTDDPASLIQLPALLHVGAGIVSGFADGDRALGQLWLAGQGRDRGAAWQASDDGLDTRLLTRLHGNPEMRLPPPRFIDASEVGSLEIDTGTTFDDTTGAGAMLRGLTVRMAPGTEMERVQLTLMNLGSGRVMPPAILLPGRSFERRQLPAEWVGRHLLTARRDGGGRLWRFLTWRDDAALGEGAEPRPDAGMAAAPPTLPRLPATPPMRLSPGTVPRLPGSIDAPVPPATPPSVQTATSQPQRAGFTAHLASYYSSADARAGWPVLQRQSEGMLDGLEPVIFTVDRPGTSTIYRLATGLFQNFDDARSFCGPLKAMDLYCEAVRHDGR